VREPTIPRRNGTDGVPAARVQIRLDKNLIKPAGPEAPCMLVFPKYDVKNGVDLEFPFDEELTGLIDEYLHHFRPTLLRGSNELWLFPGETGGCKDAKTLSDQITERVEKATGLFITACLISGKTRCQGKSHLRPILALGTLTSSVTQRVK
jgi:hypothetical protein